jgi:hypothetical protein
VQWTGIQGAYVSCSSNALAMLLTDSLQPDAMLLLHPVSLQLLRQCVSQMRAFKTFVLAFEAAPGVVAVEIARSVIVDIFRGDAATTLDAWDTFFEQAGRHAEASLGARPPPNADLA